MPDYAKSDAPLAPLVAAKWDNRLQCLSDSTSPYLFCRTKCSYCNFASDVFSRAIFRRYVDRVCADIGSAATTAEKMGGRLDHSVDSIYLGGGTPTVLDFEDLERLFTAISQNFDISHDTEATVECAPGTLTSATLTLQRCGVNRVSLGVQSFVDIEAAAVGRQHNRATVLDDIARLRASGLHNINVDLIAGLPHQTPRQLADFSRRLGRLGRPSCQRVHT